MDLNELPGDYVTLRHIDKSRVDELLQTLQTPSLYVNAGFTKPPEADVLKRRYVEKETLRMWEAHDLSTDEIKGYGGVILFRGPPQLFAWIPEDTTDDRITVGRDIVLRMADVLFNSTDAPSAYCFFDYPIDETFHETLLAAGFDPRDDYPDMNPETETCYVMHRETYNAYWGEEEDD